MIFTKLKRVVAAIFVLAITSSLFAVEEYVSKIYKDIDVIFIEKSDEKLNDLLQTNKDDKYYYLIENYAEKKIRRLIVVNDYEFAMNAIVVVIENNLDNEEAVEMYSIIAEAYETQIEYEERLEQERQKELARVQGEKEKKRGEVEKEYLSSKTAEGGNVFVTGRETKSSNTECDVAFGMVNFSLINELESKFMGMNYGLSMNVNYVYNKDNLAIGADAYADIHMLAFGSDDFIPLLMNLDFAMKAATKKLSKNLFARVGVATYSAGKMKDAGASAAVADLLFSPTIGVELNKIQLGGMKFTMSGDYLLGTIWTKGYKAGVQGMLDFSIPYAQLDRVNLNFHVGLKDMFLLKTTGSENRASVILAIGAENVNR